MRPQAGIWLFVRWTAAVVAVALLVVWIGSIWWTIFGARGGWVVGIHSGRLDVEGPRTTMSARTGAAAEGWHVMRRAPVEQWGWWWWRSEVGVKGHVFVLVPLWMPAALAGAAALGAHGLERRSRRRSQK